MSTFISILLFGTFLALAALHFYWGFGGKWGLDAALPTNENNTRVINPKAVDCFIVGIGLLSFGVFVLVMAGWIEVPLPKWIRNYGLWALAAIFILRAVGEFRYVGFFKKIKGTPFAEMDTKYYAPLCLGIGVLVVVFTLT